MLTIFWCVFLYNKLPLEFDNVASLFGILLIFILTLAYDLIAVKGWIEL